MQLELAVRPRRYFMTSMDAKGAILQRADAAAAAAANA